MVSGGAPISPLPGKRVVVTDGAGFLGRAVYARLADCHPAAVVVPRKAEYDLTEQARARALLDDAKPDVIFHLTAVVGGTGANRENPGRYFYENAVMGLLREEEARTRNV